MLIGAPCRRTRDRVVKYALGAQVRHAKFAGRMIGNMKDEELALKVVNVRPRLVTVRYTCPVR
jgi:hypothetical protein